MNQPRKRTAREVLASLEQMEADDDAAERALQMRPEEVDAELREAGVDLERERAEADEIRERFASLAARADAPAASEVNGGRPEIARAVAMDELEGEPRGKVIRLRKMVPLWLVAAAFAALAATGALGIARVWETKDPRTPAPPYTAPLPEPMPDMRAAVATMRQHAKDSFARKEWEESLKALEQAKTIDPAGDADPDLQKLREEATKQLRKQDEEGTKKGDSRKAP